MSFLGILLVCIFIAVCNDIQPTYSHRYALSRMRRPPPVHYVVEDDSDEMGMDVYERRSMIQARGPGGCPSGSGRLAEAMGTRQLQCDDGPHTTLYQTQYCPLAQRAEGFKIGHRKSRFPSGWPWHNGVESCVYAFILLCGPKKTPVSVRGFRDLDATTDAYNIGQLQRWHYWKIKGKIFKMEVFGNTSPTWTSPDRPAGALKLTTQNCPIGKKAVGMTGVFLGYYVDQPDYLTDIQIICG